MTNVGEQVSVGKMECCVSSWTWCSSAVWIANSNEDAFVTKKYSCAAWYSQGCTAIPKSIAVLQQLGAFCLCGQ